MARRHWLDPLARRLLIASGQIKPPPVAAPSFTVSAPAGPPAGDGRRLRSAEHAQPVHPEADQQAIDHHEQVERDLLALKLAQKPGLRLRDGEAVRRAAALGWRLDVNRATAADWARLPGCSADHADLLGRLQAGGVQLSGPEDLGQVLQLPQATLQAWLPLLEFRWYGDGPPPAPAPTVAVNQAGPGQLALLSGLTPERSSRLLRERARAPFRDLADLGERLALPPALLEQWIGRVSFQAGPAGPELPPARRPGAGQPPGGPSRSGDPSRSGGPSSP
jgi:DNA uptake protein ComE-like DNA-binding protein